MLRYHVVFLLLVVGSAGFFLGLAALNVNHAERSIRERADWLGSELAIEDPDRLRTYHRLTTATGQLKRVLGVGALLIVLYLGLFGDVVEMVYGLIEGDLLAGIVLFIGLTAVMEIYRLPFNAFETFGIEAAFGFNEQSPRLFFRDTILSGLLGVALVTVVGGAILLVIERFPNWWWLGGTAVVAGFSLLSQVLIPRLVMPLFYDFEPIENGELRAAVEDVFDRAGFDCEDVYEMNASSRSGHSNAFFTGFGAAKRVVLYDTLIDQLEETQLQGVLAHELAHWKKGHVWQGIGVGILQTGILLFVAQYLLDQPWLYAMFDVPSVSAAGLLIAFMWLNPLQSFLQPISNQLWLKNEREADAFAADVIGEGEPLAEALSTLHRENLSNPFPHPWYELFYYQHPPITERISDLTGEDTQ